MTGDSLKITTFDEMISFARRHGPIRIAVAAADDPEVLVSVDQAARQGIVQATLIGDWPAMEAYAAQTKVDLSNVTIIHEPDRLRAAQQVVNLAREHRAEVVVKGQIKTAELLGVALNRHVGIRGQGLLTHVGVYELPGLDRLIYLSDAGVVVYPDVYQKLEIINNVVVVARLFGISRPKVAILAASETVHPKIPASIDALALSKMAEQGWVKSAVVDGPMSFEVAISPRAAQLEETDSPIAGLADVLIVPNVEAGNILGKGLVYLAGARMAGIVVGAKVPIIINSRADSAEARYLSLAMAVVLTVGRGTG
jgi:phosphate butyryltransferase